MEKYELVYCVYISDPVLPAGSLKGKPCSKRSSWADCVQRAPRGVGRWRVDTLPCRNLPGPHGLSHRRYSGSLPPHLSPHGRSTATCPGHSGPLEESSGCPDQGELSEARPLLRVCMGQGCAAHAPCHLLPWAEWVTGGMVEEAHQPGTKGQQQPSEELLGGGGGRSPDLQ